jgi:hypothetical protein
MVNIQISFIFFINCNSYNKEKPILNEDLNQMEYYKYELQFLRSTNYY